MRSGSQAGELTDGWALFLESIEGVPATASKRFDREDQCALETIRAARPRCRLSAMTGVAKLDISCSTTPDSGDLVRTL